MLKRKYFILKLKFIGEIAAIFIIGFFMWSSFSMSTIYHRYPLFHVISICSIIIILSVYVYGRLLSKKGKSQRQLEMESWRGLILLIIPLFIIIGCSILNSAYLGENKLNKQILGFLLCTYPVVIILAFSNYIEKKMNKSDKIHNNLKEQHDEHNDKIDLLGNNVNHIKDITLDIKVKISKTDQEFIQSIERVFEGTIKHNLKLLIEQNEEINSNTSYIQSMLDRLTLSHGYAYTAKQVTDLDAAKLSLGNKAWKAQQVKKYFEIMGVQNKQEISKIKELKKIISKTKGKRSVTYCTKSVEKYVMPDVTQARQIMLKKLKRTEKKS